MLEELLLHDAVFNAVSTEGSLCSVLSISRFEILS